MACGTGRQIRQVLHAIACLRSSLDLDFWALPEITSTSVLLSFILVSFNPNYLVAVGCIFQLKERESVIGKKEMLICTG